MGTQEHDEDVLAEINRAHNHGETPDLSDWNLYKANLTQATLIRNNLQGANLTRADLTEARLVGNAITDHQLLSTRGLNPPPHPHYMPRGETPHDIPTETWNRILPINRELLTELLRDWDGTLREAIATAELLRTA